MSNEVIVGDLDIAGLGHHDPRDENSDLELVLMDTGTGKFANYEREHPADSFAILVGGRVLTTFRVGDPNYRRPVTIPHLRPLAPPGIITMPGLAPDEVKRLSGLFAAETALEWCGRHAASTDHDTQSHCAGYKSQADLTAPSPVINAGTLRASPALVGDALEFDCALPKRYGPGPVLSLPAEKQRELMRMKCHGLFGLSPDGLLAPPDAHSVKLALRAAFHPAFRLPPFEIHIAVSSEEDGSYLLAQRDGSWETRTGKLSRSDISRILTALETAHFWQQPFDHQDGMLDGEPVLIEAAFGNWRSTATQNAYGGVDLDILEQQLLSIAKEHNVKRPLASFQ